MKGTVRTSTYEAYRYMVEPHLVPFFGSLKLGDLNPVHVRALYREKLEAGLSASTVRKMHAVLNKAMKQAVMDGLVHRNVCDSVRPPRLARKEIRPLDPEQAIAFLRAAASDRLEALYVLAVHTGIREGELLGLRWEDVRLEGEKPALRLRRALVREGGKLAFGLKTPKSRRQVRLTRAAAGALRAHLARQMEEIEHAGSSYRPGGLVLATEHGSPVNPSNLRNRSFKPLLRRAGLEHICFHDLRHTCATLLFARNVHPKLVQELLGTPRSP